MRMFYFIFKQCISSLSDRKHSQSTPAKDQRPSLPANLLWLFLFHLREKSAFYSVGLSSRCTITQSVFLLRSFGCVCSVWPRYMKKSFFFLFVFGKNIPGAHTLTLTLQSMLYWNGDELFVLEAKCKRNPGNFENFRLQIQNVGLRRFAALCRWTCSG